MKLQRRHRCWLAAALWAFCSAALAHGFEERHELPVPLFTVILVACATVALTFAATVYFSLRTACAGRAEPAGDRVDKVLTLPKALQIFIRACALLLLTLTIATALFGSQDPLMNLAPTMVWVVVWLGVSFVCVFVANIWPLLDPWRSLFELLQALTARRNGRNVEPARGTFTPQWPVALGMWPAVALLLLWCWLEIVFPLASSPFKVGVALLLWTLLNLCGMWLFGRAVWQAHADVFALVFETLGRLAPLRLQPHQPIRHVAGQAAFIIALLATVIFDGLHGGATWFVFEGALGKLVQGRQDINGTLVGSAGLLCVWLLMLGAYALAVLLTLRLTSPLKLASLQTPIAAGTLAAQLAITLVPIAAAYLVAHNFSTMVTQGLAIVPLLSDPFGWQWNLLGTTRWTVDTSWLGAQLTWNVALLAIVLGHMVSVVWAHRVVLRAGVAPRRAAWGLLPMTLLMLAFTAMSLFLIAEPMVVSPP